MKHYSCNILTFVGKMMLIKYYSMCWNGAKRALKTSCHAASK